MQHSNAMKTQIRHYATIPTSLHRVAGNCVRLSTTGLSEQITYRETKRIVEIVDRVAKNRGLQRTDVIREAVRTDPTSPSKRRKTSDSTTKQNEVDEEVDEEKRSKRLEELKELGFSGVIKH